MRPRPSFSKNLQKHRARFSLELQKMYDELDSFDKSFALLFVDALQVAHDGAMFDESMKIRFYDVANDHNIPYGDL